MYDIKLKVSVDTEEAAKAVKAIEQEAKRAHECIQSLNHDRANVVHTKLEYLDRLIKLMGLEPTPFGDRVIAICNSIERDFGGVDVSYSGDTTVLSIHEVGEEESPDPSAR